MTNSYVITALFSNGINDCTKRICRTIIFSPLIVKNEKFNIFSSIESRGGLFRWKTIESELLCHNSTMRSNKREDF